MYNRDEDVIILEPQSSGIPVIMSFLVGISLICTSIYMYMNSIGSHLGMVSMLAGGIIIPVISISSTNKYRNFITNKAVISWGWYPQESVDIVLSGDKNNPEYQESMSDVQSSMERHMHSISLDSIDYVYANSGAKLSFRRIFGYGNVNFCSSIYKTPEVVFRNVQDPQSVVDFVNDLITNK